MRPTKIPPPHHPVHSQGIYHGLPTLPSAVDDDAVPARGHTVVVCGVNGISGRAMLRVYVLARRGRGRVEGAEGEGLDEDGLRGKEGGGREGEARGEEVYVFFFAYKEVGDQSVMEVENVALLRNFLEGAAVAGVKVKRIVLQTGGKVCSCHHHGVHQGPYKVPAREDDLRVELGQNFYYKQDLLAELAPKYGFDYVIVRPMAIIGAVKGNFLNLAMALGLYLAVTKELGDKPMFNGKFEKYHSTEMLSSATMNA